MEYKTYIIYLVGFLIVAVASNQIAKVFQKIKFPIITGLIITGIIAGPSVLNFITDEAIKKLNFLNEIALSIIAFSAGSELYLNELRSRIKSIKWMVIGQLSITFIISSVAIYYAADMIPFMAEMSPKYKIAVAILFGTIFVARSPSSAIAVINEMRANGPFTKTVMGVTVVKDVLVIILFAVCFSMSKAFINGEEIGFSFLLILLVELFVSIGIGYLVGKLLAVVPLSLKISHKLKAVIIVIIGYSVYVFANYVRHASENIVEHGFVLEPLLISIIAGFVVTNYSKHRIEFAELLEEVSPIIYIIFFTLTGASLSLQTLASVFWIAIALFFLRLVTMFFGGIFGVVMAKDDKKYTYVAWMPYLTQAGVALGLATIVANEFPAWGYQFETIVIAIIVINQLVGPPLFKWILNYVKESHTKANLQEFDGTRDALIFGVEDQSIALAQQLEKHNWETRLVCIDEVNFSRDIAIDTVIIKDLTMQSLQKLQLEKTEAIVLMLSDTKNYTLAENIYENIGTANVIVRLNNRENFEKFHKLGALIIEPSTAMVSLLDHFVRSPNAASLLLGMEADQETMDIEIRNEDIQGLRLRDLRLPSDVLVLSIKRKGQLLVSHGYTRLRLGDIMTLVGAEKSLEELIFKFDS